MVGVAGEPTSASRDGLGGSWQSPCRRSPACRHVGEMMVTSRPGRLPHRAKNGPPIRCCHPERRSPFGFAQGTLCDRVEGSHAPVIGCMRSLHFARKLASVGMTERGGKLAEFTLSA